jgi:hypothetical protein
MFTECRALARRCCIAQEGMTDEIGAIGAEIKSNRCAVGIVRQIEKLLNAWAWIHANVRASVRLIHA